MRILILGAGAIGGYFGGRLVEAGADVTFLVRPRRAEQLARDGLVIESDFGNVKLPVKCITGGAGDASFDMAIVACKAYDLTAAVSDIAPYVGQDAGILPLLNGIAHLDLLRETFGAENVLGGTCHIGATVTPSGAVRHLNRLQSITFGELSGDQSERASTFGNLLERAKLDARLSTDILQDMWNKFVMLATLAGTTCLMRASIGDIMKCEGGRHLITEMLQECEDIAAAAGRRPDADFMARTRRDLTTRGSPQTSSMLRDVRSGGRTEADHILGDMVRRAQGAGIAAPLIHAAYCHLQAYEMGHQAKDQ